MVALFRLNDMANPFQVVQFEKVANNGRILYSNWVYKGQSNRHAKMNKS
jgi:hypothetical protein